MENNQGVATDEWNVYVNEACADLYHKLVQQWAYDRFESETEYQISDNKAMELSGSSLIPIDPTGWLALLSVQLTYPNGSVTQLTPFTHLDRDKKYWGGYVWRRDPIRYRVVMGGQNGRWGSSSVQFEPADKANGWTGIMRFVPDYVDMVNDTDQFDGRITGWDAFVAIEAGIKARRKMRLETGDLDAERLEILKDIDTAGYLFNRGGALKQVRRSRW